MRAPIAGLVEALTADLVEADAWLRAFQRQDADEPPWVYAMGRQLERIRASAEAIERHSATTGATP